MKKTIRLIIPQWKGGDNPNYLLGAQVLAFIAPSSKSEKTIEINLEPVSENKDRNETIIYTKEQLTEIKRIKQVLKEEDPDRIIVFGGDCSVSQVPFDYLNNKYEGKLGLIWIDSHPDISTIEISNHNHEFVLANLLGLGENEIVKAIETPFDSNKTTYVGLIENPDEKLKALNIKIGNFTIKERQSFEQWLKDNDITKVCVHLDLDVLSPEYFYSLTSNKPHQTVVEYGAAIGKLELPEVVQFLINLNKKAEIVGLTIAELIPWDLISLRENLSRLPIFEAK